MNSDIETSKGSALFTQGRLLLLFVVFAILFSISSLSYLKGITLLVWSLVFIKKNLQIDVEQKKFKNGQLKRWKTLSEEEKPSLSLCRSIGFRSIRMHWCRKCMIKASLEIILNIFAL